MKAAVLRAFGSPLIIGQVSVSAPGPGKMLIKVMASGVSPTDLHAADGDWSALCGAALQCARPVGRADTLIQVHPANIVREAEIEWERRAS